MELVKPPRQLFDIPSMIYSAWVKDPRRAEMGKFRYGLAGPRCCPTLGTAYGACP
jgi:hypothetical protein